MPTLTDARALPPDHFWHPSSQQAREIARETEGRRKAAFDAEVEAAVAKRLAPPAAAPVVDDAQPATPLPPMGEI